VCQAANRTYQNPRYYVIAHENLAMAKRIPFITAVVCLLLFAACKKSSSGGSSGPNPLTGNWAFDGETTNANIVSTTTFGPLSIKVTNLIAFRTIDNVGTLTFTTDTLNAVGVGYDIDTTYTTITNTGLSIDTTTAPLVTTAQPANTSASYRLIGSDSIYFPNGSPFTINVDSVQPPIQFNGAHFKISGTTLTLTSTISLNGPETVNGITAPTTGIISSVITLNKQ
jgi:hypothetical protein